MAKKAPTTQVQKQTQRSEQKQLKIQRVAVFATLLSLFLFGGAFSAFAYTKPLEVMIADGLHAVDKPIELTISRQIDPGARIDAMIQPDVAGTWRHEPGTFRSGDTLVFTPDDALVVDTSYTISLPELDVKLGPDSSATQLVVKTEKAPGLNDSVGLASLKDKQVIAADEPLVVELTSENRNLRELELRTKPKMKLTRNIVNDKAYTWESKGYLPQGKSVSVEVYDAKNKQSLLRRTIKIAAQPRVTSPVKQTYFDANDTALIRFSEPISADSQKYISFNLSGKGSWRDEKTYQFVPSKLVPGKTYTYSIKKGLRSKQGGIATKKQNYTFQTRGSVSASASPYGYELSQASQQIRFQFDQPIDKASVQKRFSISSGKVVSTSWAGNTFIATVKNFGFQRTVTATVGAGVKNSGFGLPSVRAYSAQFTTEVRSKRLNIPYYAQQQGGTCTAATLRMALQYRGVGASEMDLVKKMGYKPREMDRGKKGNKWDDPSQMFVGYTDGGGIYRAAGPDAPPVAKAAIASGRNASHIRGASAGWIAKQIYDGNPVIMFGATRDAGFETWKTPSGKTAKMNKASHVVLVVGVKGEPSNPLGFWIHDPLYGAYYWTTGQVQANIARDAYGQAVVVY